MGTAKYAGLAALLVALISGSWLALRSCAGDATTPDAGELADSGAPAEDSGQPAGAPDAGTPGVDAGSADAGHAGSPRPWVSAYYAAWFPEMYPHERIDFTAMTHLFVGRASVQLDGTVTQALDAFPERGLARARDLSSRAHAAGKVSVLMLGGVGEGQRFRAASADPVRRAAFVSNILAFLDSAQFDGVDLDWEEDIDYPIWLQLVRDLRAARPGMFLSLAMFGVNDNFGLAADVRTFVAAAHPLVEQINLMTYGIGMAGPWGGWVTWHTGALFGSAGNHPTSISSSLATYAAAGVPKGKLGMGIGFFGINYAGNTGPLQVPAGAYQADDVEWRYSNVANSYFAPHPEALQWDDVAKQDFLSFPAPGFKPGPRFSTAGFLSFEGPRSIAAKGAWLRAEGYGGTILWVINYGCLDPASGANPLLDSVREAFLQ